MSKWNLSKYLEFRAKITLIRSSVERETIMLASLRRISFAYISTPNMFRPIVSLP